MVYLYIKMVMFNSCFVCLPGRVIPKHHHYFQPLGGKETQLADCINFRVRVPGRFFFSHLRCKWIVPPIWWIFDFFLSNSCCLRQLRCEDFPIGFLSTSGNGTQHQHLFDLPSSSMSFMDFPYVQWPFTNLNWRLLEVPTIYKAYVREYPHKIWPTICY